jgi:hypothetical protein
VPGLVSEAAAETCGVRVKWPSEGLFLDTLDQRRSHATFYTGLWGETGDCNFTMPPSVPRHTGQVLREVTPKDIRSKIKKMNKDSAPGSDDVTKIWFRE